MLDCGVSLNSQTSKLARAQQNAHQVIIVRLNVSRKFLCPIDFSEILENHQTNEETGQQYTGGETDIQTESRQTGG